MTIKVTNERIDRVAIKWAGVVHTAEQPRRHHDVIHEMAKLGFGPECMHDQGFVTDTGRFVDRKEAYLIAGRAGQIKENSHASMTHGLFSEDVW